MKRKGQVWVETVIYTLIGLAVIGILLGFATPKINSYKDQLVIEQTIDSLSKISSQIYEVQGVAGNRRVIDLKISKGKFSINSSADSIGWVIDSNYKYSELDQNVPVGSIIVRTTSGAPYTVSLTVPYNVNITSSGKEDLVEINSAPSPYSLVIENKGSSSGRVNIDLLVR